jgi:four helix bundle protein
MQHYSRLQVWQRSHKLVLNLYHMTQAFPSRERYGLTAQLRRAALSVPTNIAEGSKRAAPRDYAHFLNIAEGSLSETEYLVIVSRDLGYVPLEIASAYLAEASELLRMLHALRKTVQGDAGPKVASRKTVGC